MSKVFVISDTHFGHANIITFKRDDGKNLRPFSSVEEMDETLVDNWNRVVSPDDKVYHLGDVAINQRHLKTMARLNGRKVLIKGNHDNAKLSQYTGLFYDIRATHVYGREVGSSGASAILTHVPIHPSQLGRFPLCIHGHLHANVVMDGDKPDPRYVSVCVEHINYTPVLLDEVINAALRGHH